MLDVKIFWFRGFTFDSAQELEPSLVGKGKTLAFRLGVVGFYQRIGELLDKPIEIEPTTSLLYLLMDAECLLGSVFSPFPRGKFFWFESKVRHGSLQ
jgi:hypothetical protein